VGRDGKKTLFKSVTVVRKTETTLAVKLAPKPSRTDAIVPFVAAAVFAGGGFYLGKLSNDEAEFKDDPITGLPGTEKNKKKDYLLYGSYAAYGIAGISFLTGCWYLIRDKGPPSTATLDSRDLSWAPAVGPGYTGVSASMSW
jgi:hypothetical protein